jgi:hypothetical protein
MIHRKPVAVLLAAFISLLNFAPAFSCSSYKVTVAGKTMVGSNYDAWFTGPRIWFETKGYGAQFSGGRPDGKFGYAPQTGMNEFGLAFVSLATATPANGTAPVGKKQITSRTLYLKDILHTCKTVGEVKAYVEQYDHSLLSGDVFLYVDSSGRYLVVEPYTTTPGNDAKYVLANFCPSVVTDFGAITQPRYINGAAFLKDKIDTSLAFCRALSDTMHVCRSKHGDGTLLTSILDLNNGITNLYFYHNYERRVTFNLATELARGDHFLEIPSLFPPNEEFQELVDFKTPHNTSMLNSFLWICVGLFIVSALFYGISYFNKRAVTKFAYVKLLLVPLSLLMAFYMLVLLRTENIYYFPAPYIDSSFAIISMTSYIPFLILLLMIPLLVLNLKLFRQPLWGLPVKWVFTLNNTFYLGLVMLFTYWGFYSLLS